jgi:hypothetical protein
MVPALPIARPLTVSPLTKADHLKAPLSVYAYKYEPELTYTVPSAATTGDPTLLLPGAWLQLNVGSYLVGPNTFPCPIRVAHPLNIGHGDPA